MDDVLRAMLADLAGREMLLFIGPRPGKKSLGNLVDLKLTHCCTLLSEREDAAAIARICKKIGCSWVWLPLDGGRLDVLRQANVAEHVRNLAQAIGDEQEPRVYFHCSAGIHRTGFFVYVWLRLLGKSRDEALAALTNLRPATAEQVGEDRIDLGDELVAEIASR
jgi:protein-tyrosine phosphatase